MKAVVCLRALGVLRDLVVKLIRRRREHEGEVVAAARDHPHANADNVPSEGDSGSQGGIARFASQ
jgi:hypothetical protein